jgi:ubiquinone/menaquinone biosynthesis C-methylase UbiE
MDGLENAVARHYGADDLLARIEAGLKSSGADLANLTLEDLAPVDEFHVGGRKATQHALSRMSLSATDHVLDVGCGLGGAARYIAAQYGCRVTGIDLTPEYIDVAQQLTARLGLSASLQFETASALAMPFEDGSFDAAVTFHVAMNIQDRAGLYAEIARVLRPGATFCIYDVMKTGPGDIVYPAPWAETAETSHVASPEETLEYLRQAGFEIVETENRREFALQFFRQRIAGSESDGPPPLSIHLLMGGTWREKFKNTLQNTEAGRIAPVQMIARRTSG